MWRKIQEEEKEMKKQPAESKKPVAPIVEKQTRYIRPEKLAKYLSEGWKKSVDPVPEYHDLIKVEKG